MKNLSKFCVIALFFLIILLSGCSSPKREFEEDYQMFKDLEHVYYKASYKEAYQALTEDPSYNVIVFAYDPDLYVCPFCMEVLPILNEVALDEGIDKILYLDIRTMRVERTAEYLSLIEFIKEQVNDLETRNDKLEIIVPDVYIIQNGKILGHHIATLKDEEGKYLLNLNEEAKSELKEIYRSLFQRIK